MGITRFGPANFIYRLRLESAQCVLQAIYTNDHSMKHDCVNRVNVGSL